MSFIALCPPDGRDPLPVTEVVRRLRDAFPLVRLDADRGRNYVGRIIAGMVQDRHTLSRKQSRLAELRETQDQAVWVSFGDADEVLANCCLLPGKELFFCHPNELRGPARPLLERCAAALRYDLVTS
jgi:hypothetical protein